jgi:uncharacterized protein YbcC (UPF0753/DUF2309 family)
MPVKKVTRFRKMEDDNYSVILEASPRKSTCHKCRKIIDPELSRYKVIEHRPNWFNTSIYHKTCLPSSVKNFIMRFRKRDLIKEKIEEMDRKIESTIKEVTEIKHRRKEDYVSMLKKIRKIIMRTLREGI